MTVVSIGVISLYLQLVCGMAVLTYVIYVLNLKNALKFNFPHAWIFTIFVLISTFSWI